MLSSPLVRPPELQRSEATDEMQNGHIPDDDLGLYALDRLAESKAGCLKRAYSYARSARRGWPSGTRTCVRTRAPWRSQRGKIDAAPKARARLLQADHALRPRRIFSNRSERLAGSPELPPAQARIEAGSEASH